MRQIVYFSTAADRQSASTIAGILAESREYNLRDQLSGLLVAGGHRYLQVIEGEAGVVEATMGRICRDQRHLGVNVLVDRALPRRSFAAWSMAFCKEPRFGEFATLGGMIEQMRPHIIERKLLEQIDCFARSFVIAPADFEPCSSPWTLASDYQPTLAIDRGH